MASYAFLAKAWDLGYSSVLVPQIDLRHSPLLNLKLADCWHETTFLGFERAFSVQSKKVAFVVDDEDVIASTIELILLSKGFDARSFVNPLDALRAASSVAPKLLLTDVAMPSMDGIELANQIRRLCPGCKVLLTSGQCLSSEQLAHLALVAPQFTFLSKPIHPHLLLEKIEELLADGIA